MSSVTYFKQYLSKKIMEKQKEHSTIYNYLHGFCHDNEELSKNLFERLYRRVLLFPYWQNHLNSLQKTLKEELATFAKLHYAISFEMEELDDIAQWQLINIQREKDFMEVVRSYLQNKAAKGDYIKVLPINENRILGLILKFDAQLQVFSFSPLATLYQGKIEPLCPLSELHYSSQYELNSAHRHIVEDFNTGFFHFKIINQKVTGYHCQNFCFQPSTPFKNKSIHEIELLFSLLKKTENFFIQSQSDPHYKKLIEALHNHYRHILTVAHHDNLLETEQVLSQAKKAIKNFYPNDRLLFLLTANIDFHFRKQQNKTPTLSTAQ